MGGRRAGVVTALVALVTAGAAVSDGASAAGGDRGRAVPGAHECVPRSRAGRGKARVAWTKLRNPIFARDGMVKDQAIRLVDGRWHLFYSEPSLAAA